MTKELQDHVWKHCLPKEFKEEVKKLYAKFYNEKPHSDCSYGYLGLLIKLFGIHNLTSDTEEEVMLMVEKGKVQEVYKTSKEIVDNEQYGTCQYSMHTQIKCVLEGLFGSKCLPDEEPKPFKYKVGQKVILHFYGGEVSTITEAFNDGGVWNKYKVKMLPAHVWNENELDPYKERKPTEPKFNVGDKVILREPMTIEGFEHDCITLNGYEYLVNPEKLEPYTEPEGNIAENHNLSQHCDKSSDNPQSDKTKASTNHFGDSNEMVNDSEASLTKVPPNPSLI